MSTNAHDVFWAGLRKICWQNVASPMLMEQLESFLKENLLVVWNRVEINPAAARDYFDIPSFKIHTINDSARQIGLELLKANAINFREGENGLGVLIESHVLVFRPRNDDAL